MISAIQNIARFVWPFIIFPAVLLFLHNRLSSWDRVEPVAERLAPISSPDTPRLVATPTFTSTPIPASSPTPTTAPSFSPTGVELAGTATEMAPPPAFAAPPGGIVYVLSPSINRVGWVVSGEEGNHFGAHNIRSGVLDGNIYHGAMQFDLSFIPPGATVYAAELRLTGLNAEHLGQGGTWALSMLDEDIDENWPLHSYAQIHNARVEHTFSPALHRTTLGKGPVSVITFLGRGIVNVFTFNASQKAALEERFAHGKAAFRLDGPSAGPDNLFSWDSGYGPGSMGAGPVLRLTLGIPTPAPAAVGGRPGADTPTSTQALVMVTSTPTPENVFTVAAIAVAQTARATAIGTNTPTPSNWATPFVVTSTPPPENGATATHIAAMATAMALAVGTNTPTPSNLVTATPTPTLVIVTSTPTPDDILMAAASARTATARAIMIGTATSTPLNWVTPLAVTSTPTPENGATAEMVSMLLTAQAIITGTVTPTPPNQFTATPTPLLTAVNVPTSTPVPTPTATPDPLQMPPVLKGMIAFLSDREGEEAAYVMNPDGSFIARLTNRWAYDLACELDTFSPDRSQRLFVRADKQDTCLECEGRYDRQIWVQNLADGWVWLLVDNAEQVHPSSRGSAYSIYVPGWDFDPAWSPDSTHIAYVSTTDSNQEIHVIDKDDRSRPDRRLTINEAADGHPSWSPDGCQVVFWSDRDVGRRQIWLMDAEGNNQRSLSNNSPHHDWDPVWIKWP